MMEEKYNFLVRFYTNNAKELKKFIPMERVFNPNWKNEEERLIDLCSEMTRKLNDIRADLQVIYDTKLDFIPLVVDVYLKEFDLSKAITEIPKLQLQWVQSKKLAQEEKTNPLTVECQRV